MAPYLAELGVSHVYCSPVLAAAPGSAHGYDVVDHSRLSEELGGDDGWAALVEACETHGLGLVVDVVPNHMAVPTPERLNRALWEVLRDGRDSPYAAWFDIDWDAQGGKLLMPILGGPLHEVAGEVTVDRRAGVVRYFDHELPMAPGTTTLEEQHYRLCDWRLANRELNYRRFFDVTSLIGVRVEDPAVFDATHARVLSLLGPVDGLRIDHPDGLADPGGYLDRLAEASGGTWTVVEKILEPGEALPGHWRCAGTTGYDALNAVLRLLVDPTAAPALTAFYTELTGMPSDFATVVEASKRQVLSQTFSAEVTRLVRDLGRPSAADAAIEVLVALDIYRVYPDDATSLRHLDEAVALASRRRPDLLADIRWVGEHATIQRFGQTTGPVMAKGVEDTALYRWHRFAALNEVGGDPARFGDDVAAWHEFCGRLAADWPQTMTTLSTHDTKRSADVRARLAVLSEIPDEWRAAVTGWRERAAQHGPPDPNTDYLMWQSLVGAWPIDAERLTAYLEKASREAKLETSWTEPNRDYDERLRRYVGRVMADEDLLVAVSGWVTDKLADPGRSNMLAQKLLQLTMPGVPDIYQGDEVPDHSLVDPDNRRPVDYELRRQLLTTGSESKLHVTTTAARLRRDRPQLVGAPYLPLAVSGQAAGHAVAFGRGEDVATVVTRLPVSLQRRGGWGDTTLDLAGEGWRDILTDREVTSPALSGLLRELPVALLVR